jgi:hypothetical protein
MGPKHNDHDEWQPNHSETADLAHRYYLERGCEPGREHEDWCRAEAELKRRYGTSENRAPDRTVVGVFHSMEQAQKAFDDLTAEGFSRDDISFIANKAGTSDWTEPARPERSDMIVAGDKVSNVAGDAGIGAAIGGVGGLLLSFAGMAIPGVGPILAAGPIVAALGGAGLGATAGGIIGVLTEVGVPEEDAGVYAEGVRRGGILLTVRGAGEKADRAAKILDENGAVDIDDRVSDWRTRGWTRHETDAQPLTEDEVRREREYFSAARRQGAELQALSKNTAGSSVQKGKSPRGKKHTAAPQPAPQAVAPQSVPRNAARIYDR